MKLINGLLDNFFLPLEINNHTFESLLRQFRKAQAQLCNTLSRLWITIGVIASIQQILFKEMNDSPHRCRGRYKNIKVSPNNV